MSKRGSVLLVDQDSQLVTILASFLTAQGYRAIFTTRVREAIKKLRNQKFSHVFVDPDLRPDSPSELLAEVTDPNSLNFQTPITLMTAKLNEEVKLEEAKRLSAIMQKPFTLREFLFRLNGKTASK